ncbi:hypothetical protein Ddye_010766 [Dipteronia dyeriana]|uniref:Legume lectin domain-containing protein n=1 Tax=Dipteronia dyeriana TaxID=168575 RepID=A0AAE0CNM1_9ROSI|nr:hypothetical protein Ddye_010766 [Dipteronia dyeriana]
MLPAWCLLSFSFSFLLGLQEEKKIACDVMVGAVRVTSIFIVPVLLLVLVLVDCEKVKLIEHELGPFNSSFYPILSVIPPALISNDALQITPDSAGNFTLTNRSGRVFFKQPFMLWRGSKLASFNSSFLINIFRLPNTSAPGEGFAFLIAPDHTTLPSNSHSQFLGLTNSTTDGLSSNHFLAIELDTFKQDFDPDANHIGLDINSVHSNKTVSLSDVGIEIAPAGTKFNAVWVHYDGVNQLLDVYIAEQDDGAEGLTVSRPQKPVLSSKVDLRSIIKQQSYFGFAASTGEAIQLNCVLRWNITVEDLGGQDNKVVVKKIGLAVGIPLLVLLLILVGVLGYCLHKKRAATSGPNILGALKSLPGMPREFREGRILDAVDQRLGTDYVAEEAERLLLLGLACSHPIASERPKTQGIVQIISGSVAVSHVPPFKPPFVWPSMSGPSGISITTSMANTLGTTSVTSGWSPQYLSRDSYIQGQEYSDSSSLV